MKLILALTAAALLTAPTIAAQCRDPKTQRFTKCPPAAAPASMKVDKNGKCHDAKGRFTKCPK